MARLEALLSLRPGAESHRQALTQVGRPWTAELTWLDPRNACLSLSAGPSALPVQVLMELPGNNQLVVMVNSREGMGSGAPLSRGVLQQVLARLEELLPGATVTYRSDRDGPIRREPSHRHQG